jgi:hypothetical protein
LFENSLDCLKEDGCWARPAENPHRVAAAMRRLTKNSVPRELPPALAKSANVSAPRSSPGHIEAAQISHAIDFGQKY